MGEPIHPVRGMNDVLPEAIGAWQYFESCTREVLTAYGYEEIRQPGFTTVSLFVVGNDGVLIADGQGSPAATQTMLNHIAKVTSKPVKNEPKLEAQAS